MTHTLLLKLEGVLQSWGTSSAHNKRDTGLTPTKSGVVGLLACVLGIPRDGDLSMLRDLRFGVRVDVPGKKMTDYHTAEYIISSGANAGKTKLNISHRDYLQDACFLVGLESENKQLLEEIAYATKHPVWAPFLGRKSCPPSSPLFVGIRDTALYDALYEESWQASVWKKELAEASAKPKVLRILTEDPAANTVVKDEPVTFSFDRREYTYRGICSMPPKIVKFNAN